jgi:hypothetical protein
MREKLNGRLGFLMLAAGCAGGLGNVWRFPFVVGQNGGAAFVLIYLFFLMLFGFPLMLLATLAPVKPYLTMALLVVFFVVMNIILFRSAIFKTRKKEKSKQ